MKELEILEADANFRRNSFELYKSGEGEGGEGGAGAKKVNTTGKPNHGEHGLVDDLGP